MNELNPAHHDTLRLPLWSGRLELGQLALTISLRRKDEGYIPLTRVHNRIESLRVERCMSQIELARALNISEQTLKAVESGSYMPSLELSLRISAFFELPIECVFSYE